MATDQSFTRAPIVTIMGHVDHGKTSLLDKIRATEVQKSESGGITQAIGGYQVTHQGSPITFIDTPGHAAFSQMRARGGKAADIVVLVVAADDGVQPQTVEAISHIRAAGCAMMVAINKIDQPASNPALIKKQLADQKIELKEYGGDIEVVETSALTGQGLDELLDKILLMAGRLNLAANPRLAARGIVIESYLHTKQGPVATGLVLDGTLHTRDVVVAGSTWGRVKKMTDWQGQNVRAAGPSSSIEILGLGSVPATGTTFEVVADQATAQEKIRLHQQQNQQYQRITPGERVKQAFMSQKVKVVSLVVKADAQGSLEAVVNSIKGLETDQVKIKILHQGVGEISENDVFLAVPVQGVILGFKVGISTAAEQLAQKEKILHRTYDVIYHLLEELEEVIAGEIQAAAKKVVGEGVIKQLFELSDGSVVTGSEVKSGQFKTGQKIEIMRDKKVVGESKIVSLRQGKAEVKNVSKGQDCGILLKPQIQTRPGDIIQAIEQ